MPKIRLYEDERYPEYAVDMDGFSNGLDVNVPAATLKRWRRVARQFDRIQAEMRVAYNAELDKLERKDSSDA